ncbi:MAG: LacI family DNA-binding transcriptional regulator [Devosia sp.]
MEDVARVAGVSPITVSRALSNPEKVRDETRQRILEAVAQTGYVVNRFASSLRSGRSTIVTVFVSNLLNPHFATSIQGIVEAFEGSGFHLMFAQIGYSELVEVDVVNNALPFRPAGAIFTGVIRSEQTREVIGQLGIPTVEMWGHHDDPIDMLVGFSNSGAGRLMGRHFGEQGFQRIAYSGHTTERGAERIQGFRDGLAEHGAELLLVHPMEGTRSVSDGMQAFDAILDKLPDVDAIFFGTDMLATGAIIRAQERSIAVPDQIALAGFGGLDFTEHVKPSLTTLNIEGYKMGLKAGRMLLARLRDETVADPISDYPIELLERNSTRRARR